MVLENWSSAKYRASVIKTGSISCEVFGTVQFVVNRDDNPPKQEDWNVVLEAAHNMRPHDGLLVLSRAMVTPQQRTDLRTLHEANPNMKVALLTDSRVTRGILTALSWFNVPTRAFSPGELGKALDFLGFPKLETEIAPLMEKFSKDPDSFFL